jgi:hypothetical protein
MAPEACWYTTQSQINPQVHGYQYSFHQGVFHVSISTGNEKYSSPKLIRLWERADKEMTTKRRDVNDRRVERILTGTLALPANQVTSILLALSWSEGAQSGYGKGWERGRYVHHSYDAYRINHTHAVEYRGRTGLSLPAGYHKQSVALGVFQVTSSLGTAPTLSITTSLNAQVMQSLRAR